MRCVRLSLILLLAVPGLLLTILANSPAADLPRGISLDQVRAQLGPPTRVSREIIAFRGVEQWHYGPPQNVRIVFDCPRGQTPRLVGQHPTAP